MQDSSATYLELETTAEALYWQALSNVQPLNNLLQNARQFIANRHTQQQAGHDMLSAMAPPLLETIAEADEYIGYDHNCNNWDLN